MGGLWKVMLPLSDLNVRADPALRNSIKPNSDSRERSRASRLSPNLGSR